MKNIINKQEGQLNLFGNNITTTSTTKELLPNNAWKILGKFYLYGDVQTIPELEKICLGQMHLNTIRTMIKILLRNKLIRLHYNQSGITRKVKIYILTKEGAELWDIYCDK